MLKTKIEEVLKEALKNKDESKASTFRLLLSAIKNAEIDKRGKLDDGEVLAIIKKAVKERDEAIELYKKGDREELAEKEEQEKKILQEYLPKEASDEEIKKAVDGVLKASGESPNFGQVMGVVMGELKGQADGKRVAEIVKEKLNKR